MADLPSSEPLPANAPQPIFNPAGTTTFLFLADPQQWRSDDGNYRKDSCSDLNAALNALDVGTINAVFFGGDMCQTGGDHDALDQLIRSPPTYHGGSELVKSRALYQTGFDVNQDVTLLKYDPKYFGLGNHDIQTEFTPDIGWFKGRWSGDVSEPHNYWRYQMWNFVSQMHTGYEKALNTPGTDAVYPIDWQNIDTNAGKGSFDYRDHSFNYVIDLGPVDVFQLHRYGGDSDGGRQSGLGWLQTKLTDRGPLRPIIIVQHYLFDETTDNGGITPTWSDQQRDALLSILSPYNIIGFFVGHNHGIGPMPAWIPVPTQNPTRSVPQFRPGCAFNQNVALVQVSPSKMDVLYGTAADKIVHWSTSASFPVAFPNQIWQRNGDWNDSYFGTLKSIYADTRRVRCPAGKVIISCGLKRTSKPDPDNRLTWTLVVANRDGSEQQYIDVSGPAGTNSFPDKDGLSKFFFDLVPVTCPPGSIVSGVFFWKKQGNRVAPGLVVRDVASGEEKEITNTAFGGFYPSKDGSEHIYADTNMVARPLAGNPGVSALMQMAGVAFVQKGDNRVALKVLYCDQP
ncbi:hypothetical protein BV25DRAFT_1921334 [Artomyces pyxidatus]|uniref:Uncharacterized protein n=1 Tax=Artomyces pyxidatus TaxID=48021 RepID=A0ACB8SIW3_9AGAM|nr:hypothetical protein BV25DRAFT_1921334 [Artomyces pyxidatus]